MWTDRCLKTVCAFANTDGGYLIIGVKDPTKENQNKKNKLHTVTGIEKDIKFESKDDYSTKITNRIKASFKNVTIDYIRYHECPDGLHICEIKINRLVRTGNPCKYKDKYYERSVDTTREISMDQEINFIDDWKDN